MTDLVHCHRRVMRSSVAIVSPPAVDYANSARRVVEAFGAPGVIEGSRYLPEVRGGMTLPASTASDSIPWTPWRTGGTSPSPSALADFDEDALRIALTLARAVPAEANSLEDRTPFRPSVATTSTSLLDQVKAALGSPPDWSEVAR